MARFDIYISSKAQSDLSECVSFALRVSPDAARSLADAAYSALMSLGEYPERNPIFEMSKTYPHVIRKCVVNGRYVALYRIDDGRVVVYRILDTRRKFDCLLG